MDGSTAANESRSAGRRNERGMQRSLSLGWHKLTRHGPGRVTDVLVKRAAAGAGRLERQAAAGMEVQRT
eukprot:SAG22_NODE_13755_length_396_cov_0.626263_2_plen_68_part_01